MSPPAPPAAVVGVIEKCISYVLKNGPSFEEKLAKSDSSGQFSFLSPSDPHHEYYRWLYEQKQAEISSSKAGSGSATKPREFRFLTSIPPVSSHDLEVIKAVARYTACNSSKHAQAFFKSMERKGRRSQFSFMNKNHTLNGLFEHLTAQYRAILGARSTVSEENGKGQDLKAENGNTKESRETLGLYSPSEFFTKAYERAAYEKNHQIKQKSEQKQIRDEQLHFASIDWQDVAFVAKVNFDAVDEVSELPAPLSRMSVVARSLSSKSQNLELKKEEKKDSDKDEDIEHEGIENGDNEEIKVQKADTKPENTEPAPKVPKGMKIRAAGESRLKKKSAEAMIQCPITGEMIPESQFDNHLKVLLRDPRYKEQQDNFMKKNFTYDSNLTTDQVYENIKRLVRKRTSSDESDAKRQRS